MKTVAQPSSIDHDVDGSDDLSTVYNIVEIFHSVQGEGYRSGIPHVFIRFGRCNLRCESVSYTHLTLPTTLVV